MQAGRINAKVPFRRAWKKVSEYLSYTQGNTTHVLPSGDLVGEMTRILCPCPGICAIVLAATLSLSAAMTSSRLSINRATRHTEKKAFLPLLSIHLPLCPPACPPFLPSLTSLSQTTLAQKASSPFSLWESRPLLLSAPTLWAGPVSRASTTSPATR